MEPRTITAAGLLLVRCSGWRRCYRQFFAIPQPIIGAYLGIPGDLVCVSEMSMHIIKDY
jgi:hypothetical protein